MYKQIGFQNPIHFSLQALLTLLSVGIRGVEVPTTARTISVYIPEGRSNECTIKH